jgi:hypothetical protein
VVRLDDVYIESAEDYDHARWLVRLSYLYHVGILKKTPAGAEEYAAIDVDSEVERLDLSEAARAAFDRRRGKPWRPLDDRDGVRL